MTRRALVFTGVTLAVLAGPRPLGAHSGPPFPVVSKRVIGAYEVEIWTDPDATNDGSRAGRFWVVLHAASSTQSPPPPTRVTVTIVPANHGAAQSGAAAAVDGDISRQFVALLMDHEGRYTVRVSIEGPLGRATVDAEVDATYDQRPSPIAVILSVVPFVLVGLLWIKKLTSRRRSRL